jgi:hypothetical protein
MKSWPRKSIFTPVELTYSIQALALNGKDGEFIPKLLVRSKALVDKLPRTAGAVE